MKSLLISILYAFLLTSCSISYYFKGKDIQKNQTKLSRQFDKALIQFDKAKDNSKIFTQLKQTNVSEDFMKKFSATMNNCYSYRDKIKNLKRENQRAYKKLKINPKIKYTEKDKKYVEIKKYYDSLKPFEKKTQAVFDDAKDACEKPSVLLKNKEIKSLNAKTVYKKFQAHKKSLISTMKKVKKQMSKFTSKVKKSSLKNKKKILEKISEINPILSRIKKQSLNVDKEVSVLEKAYGQKGPILVSPGTVAHKMIEQLESQVVEYNSLIKNYDLKINEINQLVKE